MFDQNNNELLFYQIMEKQNVACALCIVVYANRLIDTYRISMEKSVLFPSLPSTTTNNKQ